VLVFPLSSVTFRFQQIMSGYIYDSIGREYNKSRRADPYLTTRVSLLLQARKEGRYLDLGCGTGNYYQALLAQGLQVIGVDPSVVMLQQALEQCPEGQFVKAAAEDLPFPPASFDGVLALFTFHHWTNKEKGLAEVARVLKPGGRFVCLSFCPEQMKGYWLDEYFPEMMERSWALAPEKPVMERLLIDAGFKIVFTENYSIQEDLTDHFLYAGKHHPEWYLDPGFRENTSSFRLLADSDELEYGLHRLEKDIRSGKVKEVMDSYANDHGDYLFYIAST
ncbi:MAG: class I SAM-dependent methyltransferase, partial [Sphingobacteriales bacterium]